MIKKEGKKSKYVNVQTRSGRSSKGGRSDRERLGVLLTGLNF